MVFVVSFSSCLDIVAIEVRFGFDADGVKVCMPRRWMRRSLVRFPLRLAGILFHTLTLTHTNTYVSTHNQRRWTAAARSTRTTSSPPWGPPIWWRAWRGGSRAAISLARCVAMFCVFCVLRGPAVCYCRCLAVPLCAPYLNLTYPPLQNQTNPQHTHPTIQTKPHHIRIQNKQKNHRPSSPTGPRPPPGSAAGS